MPGFRAVCPTPLLANESCPIWHFGTKWVSIREVVDLRVLNPMSHLCAKKNKDCRRRRPKKSVCWWPDATWPPQVCSLKGVLQKLRCWQVWVRMVGELTGKEEIVSFITFSIRLQTQSSLIRTWIIRIKTKSGPDGRRQSCGRAASGCVFSVTTLPLCLNV